MSYQPTPMHPQDVKRFIEAFNPVRCNEHISDFNMSGQVLYFSVKPDSDEVMMMVGEEVWRITNNVPAKVHSFFLFGFDQRERRKLYDELRKEFESEAG